MPILNQTNNQIIAQQYTRADSFFPRMVGLLNRSSLDEGEALIISGCNSIHMFFMRFAIDVLFVNRDDEVVGLIENIKPFRLSKIYWRASYAIELPVGGISQSQTKVGSRIQVTN
jgi:uncharacterized membrane protein (UPF0127 family)